MSDKTVYRSSHPDVLRAWDDFRAKVDEVARARRSLLDELGFEGRPGFISDHRIYGVQHLAEHGPVPAGWRRDADVYEAIVPDRRRKIGKEVSEKFAALTMPDLRKRLPGGMPETVLNLEASKRHWPALKRFGEVVYAVWSCDPEKTERGVNIDSGVWERAKLSEYYAAVEAAEASQAEQERQS